MRLSLSVSRYVGAKASFTEVVVLKHLKFTHIIEMNWEWRLGYHPKVIQQSLHAPLGALATVLIGRRTE